MKVLITILWLFIISTSAWAAPVLFYFDLTSGPNTGGQNNNGVFVTVWGANLGSSQGSSTVTVGGGSVANIQTWTTYTQAGYTFEEVCFQLGSSATTGNIVITVNSVASNGLAFTVRSGNIYFVDPSAGTNGSGTFASPFNQLYYAYNIQVAGDTVYVKSGTIYDVANGYEGYHSILCLVTTGTITNPIAWVAYPNATVNLEADSQVDSGADGGGSDSDFMNFIFRSNGANYITISKFNMSFPSYTLTSSLLSGATSATLNTVWTGKTGVLNVTWSSQDANISVSVTNGSAAISWTGGLKQNEPATLWLNNLQSEVDGQDGWREVGNNLVAGSYTYAQIIVGGVNAKALGNVVHDSGNGFVTQENEEHSIYVGGPSDPFEVGWNYMYNNQQIGWELDAYHDGQRVGSFHDNLIISHASGSDKGILVDGGAFDSGDTLSTTYNDLEYVYNNIIVNAGQNNGGDDGALEVDCGTAYVYNNTIYGNGQNVSGVMSFTNASCGPSGGNSVIYLANNIIYESNTSPYLSNGSGSAPTWAQFSLLTNNNYYGNGNGPTEDASPINANPLLVSPTNNTSGNWSLQATSPAIGAGYNTNSIVANDYNGVTRPNPPAIGAYEYSSGGGASSGYNVSLTGMLKVNGNSLI